MVKKVDDGAPRQSLSQIARAVAERLEILELYGWAPPLAGAGHRAHGGPRKAPPANACATTSAPASAPAEPTASREERLAALAKEVAPCTRCALSVGRTQTVFGVGDPAARLLLVGEAPGHEEDRRGEPFVGAAGQLLDNILSAMGLCREEVYIANVVKCRPPSNRNPDPAEVGHCLPYLERQVEIIGPEVLLALGSVAARTLLGVDDAMWRLRGRFHDYRGIPLMATYHPAYLLRKPADKGKVWQDVQQVMARLGLPPRSS